jgi:TetR/AcrR family transcriptional repressor of uid operon
MPKIVDAGAQRLEIQRAARRVFARRGVSGTGLVHVASEAGMARSSLYHYYPDKQSLVGDLVRELLREEEALFAAALTGDGTVLERIEALVRGFPQTFAEWSKLGTMIFDFWSRDAKRFRPFFRRIRSDLSRLIEAGQARHEVDPAVDAELAAATVIGAIDGLLLQHLIDPKVFPDVDALGDAIADIVRKALRP